MSEYIIDIRNHDILNKLPKLKQLKRDVLQRVNVLALECQTTEVLQLIDECWVGVFAGKLGFRCDFDKKSFDGTEIPYAILRNIAEMDKEDVLITMINVNLEEARKKKHKRKIEELTDDLELYEYCQDSKPTMSSLLVDGELYEQQFMYDVYAVCIEIMHYIDQREDDTIVIFNKLKEIVSKIIGLCFEYMSTQKTILYAHYTEKIINRVVFTDLKSFSVYMWYQWPLHYRFKLPLYEDQFEVIYDFWLTCSNCPQITEELRLKATFTLIPSLLSDAQCCERILQTAKTFNRKNNVNKVDIKMLRSLLVPNNHVEHKSVIENKFCMLDYSISCLRGK